MELVRDGYLFLASGRSPHQWQEWRAAFDAFKQVLALESENPEAFTVDRWTAGTSPERPASPAGSCSP